MASANVTALKARRTAIINELNALDSTKAGGNPNTSGAGINVDHVGYKRSLYEELREINQLLRQLDGAYEFTSDVRNE